MDRVVTAFLALLLIAAPVRALDITACDQTVPADATGVLRGDLACTNALAAVRLERNATLRLEGHAITGDFAGGIAIECVSRRCAVVGPGDISGGSWTAVSLREGARLSISDVAIHDCNTGIEGFAAGTPRNRVRATNVNLSRNRYGMVGLGVVRALDVTANGNSLVGLAVERLRGRKVTASDNGLSGIFGERVAVTGLVANGNGDGGVRVERAALRDSELTGNNGYGMGIDVLTVQPPRLVNTTCGKSGVIGGVQGSSWGVCAND